MPQRIDLKLCHLLLWWIGECSNLSNLLVSSAAPLFCRNKFEGILEALSQFETREAQVLMTEALEAMDMMNNAIILQNEVLRAPSYKMCSPICVETLKALDFGCCGANSQAAGALCNRLLCFSLMLAQEAMPSQVLATPLCQTVTPMQDNHWPQSQLSGGNQCACPTASPLDCSHAHCNINSRRLFMKPGFAICADQLHLVNDDCNVINVKLVGVDAGSDCSKKQAPGLLGS